MSTAATAAETEDASPCKDPQHAPPPGTAALQGTKLRWTCRSCGYETMLLPAAAPTGTEAYDPKREELH